MVFESRSGYTLKAYLRSIGHLGLQLMSHCSCQHIVEAKPVLRLMGIHVVRIIILIQMQLPNWQYGDMSCRSLNSCVEFKP